MCLMNYLKSIKPVFLIILFALSVFHASAQSPFPICNSVGKGEIHYEYAGAIFSFNPENQQPTTPMTTRVLTTWNVAGIAIGENINGPGPSPTYYISIPNDNLYYYNGTAWVNTGHDMVVHSLTAGGGYIFGFSGNNGNVYRYDGTGDAQLLINIPDFYHAGPYAIVADCQGNFYILKTDVVDPQDKYLRKYSPNGQLLQTWTITGFGGLRARAALAVVNNKIYFDDFANNYWQGVITGSNIHFTKLPHNYYTHSLPVDIANCPIPVLGTEVIGNVNTDTLLLCGTTDTQSVRTNNPQKNSVTWAVIKGDISIAGFGDSVSVAARTSGAITASFTNAEACGTLVVDTIDVILSDTKVDAGDMADFKLCHDQVDTLTAVLSNSTPGLSYNISWSPPQDIVSGSDSLTPVVKRDANRLYTITVSAKAGSNSCTWQDTVTVPEANTAEAAITLPPGSVCINDTVLFKSDGSSAGAKYMWHFGDGTTAEDANPFHAYSVAGSFDITLIVTNGHGCIDTAHEKLNDITGRPYIYLGGDTVLCNAESLILPGNNSASFVSEYRWSDNSVNPTYTVNTSGTYYVNVKNKCGEYADTVNVTIENCSVWFPGIFSPNRDGLNDIARARVSANTWLSEYHLMIYNRFGQEVFRTTNINEGWDGKYRNIMADVGTYYYFISYRVQGSDTKLMLKGDLTLIR